MKPSLQRIDDASGRYLPIIYPEELPYWEGLKARKIMLQHCKECSKVWFPVGPVCPGCLSDRFDWTAMSGRGVVHNFVVYERAWLPWFENKLPYAVVQVQLEEGPRLTTNMLDTPLASIRIGLPVQAVYEDVTAEITLLQFKAAGR